MNAAQEKVVAIIKDMETMYKPRAEAEYRPTNPKKTTKDIIEQIEKGLAGTDILSQLAKWIDNRRDTYNKGGIDMQELTWAESRNLFWHNKLNKIVQKYGEPKETIEEIMEIGLPYLEKYKNNTIGLAQAKE